MEQKARPNIEINHFRSNKFTTRSSIFHRLIYLAKTLELHFWSKRCSNNVSVSLSAIFSRTILSTENSKADDLCDNTLTQKPNESSANLNYTSLIWIYKQSPQTSLILPRNILGVFIWCCKNNIKITSYASLTASSQWECVKYHQWSISAEESTAGPEVNNHAHTMRADRLNDFLPFSSFFSFKQEQHEAKTHPPSINCWWSYWLLFFWLSNSSKSEQQMPVTTCQSSKDHTF